MAGWLSNLSAQFGALPAGRRVALVLAAGGSLAFFLWLGVGAGRSEYKVLFRGLAEDQAVKVLEALDVEKIAYRIGDGGTAIFVPGPLVYEARIRVAGKGLPNGGSAGFEIFDQARFGVTDFVQQVNFLRAVQGELARSIEQLDAVERARVQIAMPERSKFIRRAEPEASASVVVRLSPSKTLSAEQARGVVHLVASSVQFLDASRVTLVDTRGRMLAPDEGGPAGPNSPSSALAQQAKLEGELAQRVESILEPTVGMGSVVATVNAELDWTQTERTEEAFDPDSQVARSEQRTTDLSGENGDGAGGVPGVRANAPDALSAGTALAPGVSASRSAETINYEISKVVSRRVEPVGSIRRLNVAVLLDAKPGAADAEGVEGENTPWSEAEIAQFEELAKRAVGFSTERGDAITVTSAPFREIELAEPGGFSLDLDPALVGLLATVLNYAGLALALVLFARLLGRPIVDAIGSAPGGVVGAGLPATAAEYEASLQGQAGTVAQPSALGGAAVGRAGAIGAGAPPPPRELTLVEQVGHIADARGNDSVKALRGWLDSQG